MKKNVITLMLLITVFILTSNVSEAKKPNYDPEKITTEILAKYEALNGLMDDEKLELWDTYFLNHEMIGNIHDNKSHIGWELYHNNLMKVKSVPEDKRISVESYEIIVYPINANTAWVEGKIKAIFPDGNTRESYFYDSLIKTEDGWRVFTSVVNDIKILE